MTSARRVLRAVTFAVMLAATAVAAQDFFNQGYGYAQRRMPLRFPNATDIGTII